MASLLLFSTEIQPKRRLFECASNLDGNQGSIMDAMMSIHEWNSSWNSDLMPLLNELYELIDQVNAEFPGHKTFKRPGFDD